MKPSSAILSAAAPAIIRVIESYRSEKERLFDDRFANGLLPALFRVISEMSWTVEDITPLRLGYPVSQPATVAKRVGILGPQLKSLFAGTHLPESFRHKRTILGSNLF